MCGICGIVLKQPVLETIAAEAVVRAMADAMRHRGPDDEGYFSDGPAGVFLGHRRLAILDLSPAGRQPMWNEERSTCVLVNGEFYNWRELREGLLARGHRFASSSDAEVLVHLFEERGAAAFDALRGMYAAAAYDATRGILHLARDPLGIKPLYLFETDGLLAFASEARAFRSLPGFDGATSGDALADFLLLGSVPAPRAFARGVRALAPGERVEVREGRAAFRGASPVPGWCAAADADEPPDEASMAEALRDSVRRHLVSDAPIGLFLSGGIDSGTLAGLASEVSPAPVHTISVSLAGHALDESGLAHRTAERYGTRHRDVPLAQADFEGMLERFLEHLDQPSIDGFNTYVVSRAARDAELTVALSGVGGDELFAGYGNFARVPRLAGWMRAAAALGGAGRAAAALATAALRGGTSGERLAGLLRSAPADERGAYLACRGLFSARAMAHVLRPERRALVAAAHERFFSETAWAVERPQPPRVIVGGLEFTRYLSSQLLRDTDALAMAHGLEVRTPLVDVEVVRRALPLLASEPAGDGAPKRRLRDALRTPLPEEVARRPKQGFVFPWEEWLRGRALADFDRRLAERGAWTEWLSADGLRDVRNGYSAGRIHWSWFWALYVALRKIESPLPPPR
ncbi:MAG: asparagine synthase (glutamine-hydrolyzing) [Verrucomicrobiae bacterium]|nr:asparagine synthase (glutamine-hydrolyzing) [Verrucomicrobiae bacterium]